MGQDNSDWKKEKENQAHAIGSKNKFDIKNGFKTQTEKRHPAETSLIGVCLTSFAMGTQNGAFLGLFYIGLILSIVDVPRLLGKDKSRLSKLLKSHTLYYVAGGIGATMFFRSLGYPIPQAEYGLLAEMTKSVLNIILGAF